MRHFVVSAVVACWANSARAEDVPVQPVEGPVVAAPEEGGGLTADQRAERQQALKASVKLELAAFQQMLQQTSALVASEGASMPPEVKSAHDAGSAKAKEAQEQVAAGQYAGAWRSLHEAWAANAPALRFVFSKVDMKQLEPLVTTFIDALSARNTDLATLVGTGPAEAKTHYDAGAALLDQAKASQAAGDSKGAFAKAREAMTEFDLSVRALFKGAREDQKRRKN